MELEFTTLQKLRNAWVENFNAVKDLNLSLDELQTNLLQIEIDKYNDSISNIDKSLTLSKANLDLYNSSSQQYSQEQSNQIELLKQKEDAINAEIISVQNELQNDKLTIASKKLLNDELSNLKLDSATNQKSINDNSISQVSTVYEIQQKQNSELQKSLSLQLEIAKSIQPQNYDKISVIINSQISSQKTNLSQIKDSISTLISQRDILDKTSSAWQDNKQSSSHLSRFIRICPFNIICNL